MQFVLMIYHGSSPLPGSEAWKALPAEEQRRIYEEYGSISATPGVSPGPPLGTAKDARTVRVADGQAQVAQRAYCGTDGAVGGYLVVEVENLEAALGIAARIPAARLGGAVEIRPVATYW